MIDTSKKCGHSVETGSKWHRAHPDRCYYCEVVSTEKDLAKAKRRKSIDNSRKDMLSCVQI